MNDSYQNATSIPMDDASAHTNGNGGAISSTAEGPLCIGRVGAPPQKEATSTLRLKFFCSILGPMI
jgi:hypothetical protein